MFFDSLADFTAVLADWHVMIKAAFPQCREAQARYWSNVVISCHACQPNDPRFAGKLAYWTHLAVPLVAHWSLAGLRSNLVRRDNNQIGGPV